jgi:plastocyanin
MKKKNLIIMVTVLIGVFLLTGLTIADEEKKEGLKIVNKIIVLHEREGAKPATSKSEAGTTVIWVNHSKSPLEIVFLDKKVVLACGSPVNFIVGKSGAYESAKIPFGGTASLCFVEKGRYEYLIKVARPYYASDINRDNQGVIVIK